MSAGIVDRAAAHIKAQFKPGMSTTQIYQEAFKFLKKQEPGSAARYNLKRAIMELGPTGHPFERFVGELLQAQGYAVQVACLAQGFCVTHEVDVVAERNNNRLMVECKFRNQLGIKCDTKIALYVQARFEDIQKRLHTQKSDTPKFDKGWLLTNTKLTTEAVQYSRCVGLRAVS